MQLRRALIVGLCLLPLAGRAQEGAFVGTWQGEVPGIGPARLIITAVRPGGEVEGRMEFELRSYVSTFAAKADSINNTNRGTVSGSGLVIDAALGGTYTLNLGDNRLSGIYTRGTTYRVDVAFTKT